MHKNNPTKRRFKNIKLRCATVLLTLALLVESLAFGVIAGAKDISALFGGGGSSSSSSASNGFGRLDYNEISEQLRDDILRTMKKDLLHRIDDYDLTGAVSVILTFTDDSLVEEYQRSYADKMTYEEFKQSDTAEALKKKLEDARAPIIAELQSKSLIGEVRQSYAHILDGVYVDTTFEDLAAICELEGVSKVMVSSTYEPLEAVNNPVDVYDTGIFNSGSVKYTGKGTIVAVLDTGCDYAHSAFTTHTVADPKYNRDDIEALLSQTVASQWTQGLEAREVYYGNLTGNKIAYGYDYADKDPDIMPFENSHGTHVAGIIAGKDDVITGVAIDAQLAIMKVFSDYKDGAEDGDIIAALEDCVVLGVDAINMSLGSSCGFSYESSAEEIYKNELYGRVETAGISLVVAASNDYSSGFGGADGNTNKTGNPDSATVGSPATYSASLAVASVSGKKENYMLANGEHVVFFIKSFSTSAEEYDFFAMMNIKAGEKKTYEYVTVPGFGLAINYAGLDVKDKIALVQRGDITFEEKVQFAQEAGAAAVIIYNNVYGDITMTIGNHAKIPAVSIGKDEGEMLAARESGTLEFDLANLAGPFMSGFSSWGPTPDLKLKPEITAHGGNINSAVVGGEYDELSGTSMAAPNMCGISVLIRQYVNEKYPEMSVVEARDLVNRLCMSTATIALDRKGNPYSPRKQGAGLADLRKATTTAAYLLVDGIGKTKLELGDDPQRTGVYEMKIKLVNISDAAVSYRLGNITMTESISTSDPEYVAEIAYLLSNSSEYAVEGGKLEDGVVTVSANETATISVKITLSDADKSYIDSTFENGMFVEGFLTFDNLDANGVDLNAPFLAFYGNWGDAPIFDLDYYEVETEAHDDAIDDDDKIKADYYATTPLGSYYYDYVLPLGTYLYTMDEDEYSPIPATREHAAVSYFKSSISGLYAVYTGLLRNAKELTMKITNTDTGEVVWEKIEYNCTKSHYRGMAAPYFARLDLQMLDDKTNELFAYNNAHFEVTMSAKLDWEGGENTSDSYSFSFYLDYEAPTVTDATFRTEYDKSREENRYYVDVMVYDNHYAMSCRPVIIYDFVNEEDDITKTFSSLTEYPIPVYQQNKGEATKVTIELTDYLDMIKKSANPSGLTVYLDDYAMNGGVYFIPFPETDSEDLEFSAPEIELSINETKDLNQFFIHKDGKDNAVVSDYLYTLNWESSDPSVVTIKDGKIEALKSGTATIRVTSDSWMDFKEDGVDENEHPKYKGTPVYKELTVKVNNTVKNDDPASGKNAEIEELLFVSYDTLFAHNSDIDHSAIGRTGSTNFFDGAYSLEFYPGEKIKLNYELKPWNLSEDRYTLTWKSSNEKVATVNDEGIVVAESEGKARISLQITIDGKTSLLAARLSVEVKSEFIIENRTLVAYKGKGGDIVIPDDEGILYIGKYAFSHFDMDHKKEVPKDENGYYDIDLKKTPLGNNTVTSVVIPEGVESIDKYAFWGCSKLERVVLPKSCKTIKANAFEDCDALVDVNFDNVKIIGDYAFRNCKALSCAGLGGVASKGIYAVGAYAFEGTAIQSLELDGLSRISEGAFANCESLTTVKLGKRTRVSAAMFKGSALTEITVYSDTIGDQAFMGCADLKKVVLEGDLTYLGSAAFSGCTKLAEVAVKSELEVIGDGAFTRCISLNEFTLPNGKVVIGNRVFFDSGVAKLTLQPNTEILSLGVSAFGGSAKNSGLNLVINVSNSNKYQIVGNAIYNKAMDTLVLAIPSSATSFTVPATVKHIGNGAFAAYHNLETLTFASGSTLVSIEGNAFAGCNKLHTVVLPAQEITIGNSAFEGAGALANIDLSKVTSIGDYAFSETALTSVALTKVGVVIGNYAFASCNALTGLTLGKNAVIGDYAFTKTALVSVALDGDASVGEGAFRGCAKLESFDMADLTGTLGDFAFEGCAKLTEIVAPKLTGIGNSTFMNCTQLNLISADELVSIGSNAFITNAEKAPYATLLKKLVFPKLKSIGNNAFFGSTYVTEINLPAIETIGEMAFGSCQRLVTVKLSASYTTIANATFYYCVNLKDFDFSHIERIESMAFFLTDLPKNLVLENVTYLGDRAFVESDQRHSLESVTAPKLTYIGLEAFSGCTRLRRFSAPALEHIGDYAFIATALVEFEVGAALREVGKSVFIQCEDFEEFFATENGEKVYDKVFDNIKIKDGVLYTKNDRGYTLYCYPAAKADEEFIIPDGTTRVEAQAAYGNEHLKKVVFAESVRSISDYAFYGCKNLETVVFNSYYAPVLEGMPSVPKNEEVTINVDNVENFPGFKDLYKYSYEYMLEGSTYRRVFHANFKATVGSQGALGMTAIIPSVSDGYDSLIYKAYFTFSENENSGVPAGKFALAFMEAVYRLPESVDRFDRLLIEAAINAYNALEGHAEEKTFVDATYYEKFEKLRSQYNVNVVDGKIAHLFGMYNTEYCFNQLKDVFTEYNALTEEERASVKNPEVIDAKLAELTAAMGTEIDFSLTYAEHFPEDPEDPVEPPVGDDHDNILTIVLIIAAAVIVIAGIAVALVVVLKKKQKSAMIAADNGAESASDVSEQSAETADEQPEATDEEKNDDAKEE